MNNRREVEIIRRGFVMVKGQRHYTGEELLHRGIAALTTISTKEKNVLGAKFMDADLKIFVDYVSGVDTDCYVRLDNKEYEVLDVMNNGFMNRVLGIVLKG